MRACVTNPPRSVRMGFYSALAAVVRESKRLEELVLGLVREAAPPRLSSRTLSSTRASIGFPYTLRPPNCR
jgi:hypothetical protein